MSAAIDWVRAARVEVAKDEGGDPDEWQLEVSSCCDALFLMWSREDGNMGCSCTACGKSCAMVKFDVLSKAPA